MTTHQVRSYGPSVSTDDPTPAPRPEATTAEHDPVPQYEIRVAGRLASRWSAWFDGLTVATDDGTTVIRGPVVDQTALHGLIQKLRDVGIPLISLTRSHPTHPSSPRLIPPRKRTDMAIVTHSTTPDRTAPPRRTPMTPMRKAALIAGLAYLATFVFSIPVKFGFWADVLAKPNFVLGDGNASGVPIGAVFEVLTGLGGIVTAVALYTIAKRYSHRAALGFVTTRVLEAAMIFVGVLSILSVYTLRQDVAGGPGTDAGALVTTGHALVAMHDWTFLLGPGLMPALNALLIGSIMYRSRLLPRWIPTLGLIGAPLLLISGTATLFGVWDQISGPAALCALPIAVWEFSFGVYMTFKGFKPTAVSEESFAPVNSAILADAAA